MYYHNFTMVYIYICFSFFVSSLSKFTCSWCLFDGANDCRACCHGVFHTVISRAYYYGGQIPKQRKRFFLTQIMNNLIDLFTTLNIRLPFVVSKLNRSFLPISNSAFLNSSITRSGCVTSRCSNNRMVGLKSPYCSSCLMTFSSTFISHAKCFQFGINLMPLSKHNANCSTNGCVRTVDSFIYSKPEGDKPLSEPIDM